MGIHGAYPSQGATFVATFNTNYLQITRDCSKGITTKCSREKVEFLPIAMTEKSQAEHAKIARRNKQNRRRVTTGKTAKDYRQNTSIIT